MDSNTRKALTAVVAILGDLLGEHTEPKPEAPKARVSSGGNVVYTQAKDNTTGKCYGCQKDGMVQNRYCRSCIKGATKKAVKAHEERLTVDLTAFDRPAKASNKGRRDANCAADKCGKFTAKGETLCSTHKAALPKVAQKAAEEGLFVTLEDGKRGFRVPADLATTLKKAGFLDAEIIAAAKAKGVGHKVRKSEFDTSTLV